LEKEVIPTMSVPNNTTFDNLFDLEVAPLPRSLVAGLDDMLANFPVLPEAGKGNNNNNNNMDALSAKDDESHCEAIDAVFGDAHFQLANQKYEVKLIKLVARRTRLDHRVALLFRERNTRARDLLLRQYREDIEAVGREIVLMTAQKPARTC
jgi:hypothetical protein